MSSRGIYQGYALQGVDRKGRVAIPAPLRAVVEANNPRGPGGDIVRTLIVAAHETEKCLIAYDQAYPLELQAALSARVAQIAEPGAAPDWNPKRINMGAVDLMPFDASGRFVLQGFPRDYAQIEDLALFLSVGDFFEIWSPAMLEASKTAPERAKELARYLLKNRGEAA